MVDVEETKRAPQEWRDRRVEMTPESAVKELRDPKPMSALAAVPHATRQSIADILDDFLANGYACRAVLRDLLDAHDPERQCIAVEPDDGCMECTGGTTPRQTGPCAYHRALMLVGGGDEDATPCPSCGTMFTGDIGQAECDSCTAESMADARRRDTGR